MIPSDASTVAERWKEILRFAATMTIQVSPWLWLMAMTTVAFEGAWNLKTVGGVTLLTLLMLPLMFLVLIALQLLPRSWYR